MNIIERQQQIIIPTTFNGTSVKIKQQLYHEITSIWLHPTSKIIKLVIDEFNAIRCYCFTSNMISSKSNKHKQRPSNHTKVLISSTPTSSTLMMTIVIFTLFVLILGNNFCQCDSNSSKFNLKLHQRQGTSNSIVPTLQPTPPPITSSQQRGSPSTSTSTSKTNSHRDNLLTSLSESIERQHFRIKPIRTLVQPRPSKFDSGHESLTDAPNEMIKFANHHKPQQLSSYYVHLKDKADEGMRHIMMMHEHAAGQHQLTDVINKQSTNGTSLRWQDISFNPNRFASSLINSNKVVSQVLSYLSPVVGTKPLLDNFNIKQAIQNSSFKSLNPLNPFSARANDQIHVTNSLHGIGKKFSNHPKHIVSTDSSDNLDLSRPEQQQQQHVSTTPSTMFGSFKYSIVKPATDANKPTQDLMVDSSSQTTTTVAESENLPPKTSNNLMRVSPPPQVLGSWLKNGANQLTQSYIQDSFRDLLTISQLPILSGGPVSTAPSDLEPGGKQWLANKLAAQQVWGNKSQAFDDLLRYVYIFGTGVRRKRDPLKALRPSPLNALAAVNQRRNFFNHRPSNLFVKQASGQSLDNNEQSSRFRNRFGSILAHKNARPRGVMWDMATDPSLAVTVFHLLERASVVLPLGE